MILNLDYINLNNRFVLGSCSENIEFSKRYWATWGRSFETNRSRKKGKSSFEALKLLLSKEIRFSPRNLYTFTGSYRKTYNQLII